MNKDNKTGAWEVILEMTTVVLVTNGDLNQGGSSEKDKKWVSELATLTGYGAGTF